jgi:hypothetical protein
VLLFNCSPPYDPTPRASPPPPPAPTTSSHHHQPSFGRSLWRATSATLGDIAPPPSSLTSVNANPLMDFLHFLLSTSFILWGPAQDHVYRSETSDPRDRWRERRRGGDNVRDGGDGVPSFFFFLLHFAKKCFGGSGSPVMQEHRPR